MDWIVSPHNQNSDAKALPLNGYLEIGCLEGNLG